MTSAIKRNDPCWCNSGIKYKKCHLNRDEQVAGNPWAAVEANKKAFSEKKCCAYNRGLGPCGGRIVKAHTISRGPNLMKIADNGRVVRFKADIAQLRKNGGNITASEIGISDASTFFGFCAEHDVKLFSCIENEPFTGREDQCLAVAYRSLSRELYGKEAATHLRKTLSEADKGKLLPDQIRIQFVLRLIEQGNELAKAELGKSYDRLTQELVHPQGGVLRSLLLEFDDNIPFMMAGVWSPFTDLFGNKLQDANTSEHLEQIFMSSFAGHGNSYICISWLDTANAPGKKIADQIVEFAPKQIASICLQFAAKHLENIFYNPSWYNSLSKEEQTQLYTLAFDGCDILGSIPSAKLYFSMGFSLPKLKLTY